MFRNPLIRSSFILYTLWYWIAGLVLVVIGRADLHGLLAGFAVSLILTAGGALVGLYMTLVAEAVRMHSRMREAKAGHTHQGARLSLGRLPGVAADDAIASAPTARKE